MRVTLSIEGGFAAIPGLARPLALDSASLEPRDAELLAALVASSGLLAEQGGARPLPMRRTRKRVVRRSADARRYRLSVEEGKARRSVTLEDPLPPALAALVAFVRRKKRQRGSR